MQGFLTESHGVRQSHRAPLRFINALREKRHISCFLSGSLYFEPRKSPQAATNLREGIDNPLIGLMISRKNWGVEACHADDPAPYSGLACHHSSCPCPASANRKGKRRNTRIRRDAHGWRACTGCGPMSVQHAPCIDLHFFLSVCICVSPSCLRKQARARDRGDFPASPICRPSIEGRCRPR